MYKGKLPHYHPIIIACFVKGKWLSRSIRRWLIDSCVQYPGPLSCSGPHLASRSGLLSTLTILLHAAGWVQVSLPILEASSENGYVIGDSWALPKKSLCCFSPPPPRKRRKKSPCLTVVIMETWFNSQTWNGTYHFLIFPACFILCEIIGQNFTQISRG